MIKERYVLTSDYSTTNSFDVEEAVLGFDKYRRYITHHKVLNHCIINLITERHSVLEIYREGRLIKKIEYVCMLDLLLDNDIKISIVPGLQLTPV